MQLQSYALGEWVTGTGKNKELFHAVTGATVAQVGSSGLDYKAMLDYGRKVAGPKLRALTFHQRALMLKQLALYLMERKEEFYTVSEATGATRIDSWIDIEGGIGTLFSFASKGRRELPNTQIYLDAAPEIISKNGTFVGQHICVPLEGVAVHINAFNFPCWGMLEKMAPSIVAGMPVIIKPATLTSFLSAAMIKEIIASKILPEGAVQFIAGGVGDLFEHLTCQDVVTFTGSAKTGQLLKAHPKIISNAVRFTMEADSLNFSMLGPDISPESEEFTLFVKEVVREMTVKAGQKCTAIRRTLVPESLSTAVVKAISDSLAKIKVGDPKKEGVRMGPLAAKAQVLEVRERVKQLSVDNELVYGSPDVAEALSDQPERGAFFSPLLLLCRNPQHGTSAHDIEAFGPVNTVIPYRSLEDAIELTKLGKGSLVGSLFTLNGDVARKVVLGTASHHGRVAIINSRCAKESTGHGSPLPGLVHGGPGRAGGGEELGGIRSVLHYMQRTALQSDPTTMSAVCEQWFRGADQKHDSTHPFRKHFDELVIGETLLTKARTVTEEDVKNFADISGDYFYAHMDEQAARASLFGQRVAHGYFVLSAAAGLFVDPAPGPVLANYGLETLRFTKQVNIGDSIQARLTCKTKTAKEKKPDQPPQGVVAWDVEVFNQLKETVASYTILTLVKMSV